MFLTALKRVPFRNELFVVIATLFLLSVLPVLVVTTILSSGIGAVSNAVVSEDPTTHKVTLYNPDGSLRLIFDASTIWPVHGRVSQEFGADDSPYQAHHTGIDIAVPIGTPVAAFMGGTIIRVGYDGSEGNFVYVDHGNGIESHYLHLSVITAVKGTVVRAGDWIAFSGNSGWSTGPHLHFEVRVSQIPVDPRQLEVGSP